MLGAMSHAEADDDVWERRLALLFSDRLLEIDSEILRIDRELETLPSIPIDDHGGTGGSATIYNRARPKRERPSPWLEFRWDKPRTIDLVVLVPARNYDAGGLDSNYGVPAEFRVELLSTAGDDPVILAESNKVGSDPVRRGHPFYFSLDEPVEATSLRIVAPRLAARSAPPIFVHAWAEVFAFEGPVNVIEDSSVSGDSGAAAGEHWHWRHSFAADGQTPLGLPEVPENFRGIGFVSDPRQNEEDEAWIEIDLDEDQNIDAVWLYPARRPTFGQGRGFGFPRRFRIHVRTEGEENWRTVYEHTQKDFANPGHNPVKIPLGSQRARYVRLVAERLWKPYKHYPAFLAFSEVEVLDGTDNLASGKLVRSSDKTGNVLALGKLHWGEDSLTNGFGPQGRLVPHREWLSQLQNRLLLEQKRHALEIEAASIQIRWRRVGVTGSITLAGLSGLALLVLPIRYRLRVKRQVRRVRERIAGDLHDEVGSNLGSIQIVADLASEKRKPAEDLQTIERIAAETVSAVRDIVWLLLPSGSQRVATAEHLKETTSIMLESHEWRFEADAEVRLLSFPDATNRHLFLFYREALHNILRHAKATRIEVAMALVRGNKVVLTIFDDGVGIAKEKRDQPSTLRALRQRATSLGGDLEVESRPNEGTRLTLSFSSVGARRRLEGNNHG